MGSYTLLLSFKQQNDCMVNFLKELPDPNSPAENQPLG